MLPLAALAACNQPIGHSADRADATPKALAACRQRADEVYERQNRGAVYRSDMLAGGERDTPYAALGTPGTPNQGLASRFARETMVDDCLNASSGNPGTTPEPPTAPPPQ
jgi:hypothetical protein